VLIRPYTNADFDAFPRAHAGPGFACPFPDLRDPILVSKLVLEGDAGQVVMESLARLTGEMYLLMNRDAESAKTVGKPQERYARNCQPYKQPANKTFWRVVWMTHMPGCRPPSPHALAADSQPWAGSATMDGRLTASVCDQIKNSNPPRAEAENRNQCLVPGPA
jgi:hypothetical protein